VAPPRSASLGTLRERIEATLNDSPDRPWCIHRLYEHLLARESPRDREGSLRATEEAADQLATDGEARREAVSAVSIGVHCQDALYWSTLSDKRRLDDFGPEYESPAILHRLASHMQCRGL